MKIVVLNQKDPDPKRFVSKWGSVLPPTSLQLHGRTMASRNWCFTLNNPDSMLDPEDIPCLRYLVYQHELGASGTPHFQGYIELSKPQRMAALQAAIPGAHFETRRGTRAEARAYCMKEDSRIEGPWEEGEWKEGGQGARNDLLTVKKALDEGKTNKDIADLYFPQWVRYHRSFEEYRRLKQPQRDWPMIVEVMIGPPGVGKSRTALEENPGAFWKQRSKWWCDYAGETCIVLDEYAGWLPYDLLLRLADRYPLLLETKGGQTQCLAKKLVITSNRNPLAWYAYFHLNLNYGALKRRITHWRLWSADGTTLNTEDSEEAHRFLEKDGPVHEPTGNHPGADF